MQGNDRHVKHTLGLFGAACAALYTTAAAAGSLSVTVSGIQPNGTSVMVAICTESLEPEGCRYGDRKTASSGTLRFSFPDLPPGRYAVAAFQDLNGSGSLERTKLGLPMEPYALSNDAGRSRKPNFELAAFTLGNGNRDLSLRLQTIAHRTGAQE
jgi:uncharacterized protein (DUF2141 family)